ncbi:MAG: TadE/TadG family type IV pilus assembly protein, partial [Actinomycetota bacterium]
MLTNPRRDSLRRDDGASTLELGLVFPVLLLLAALTFPLVKAGYEYIVVSRAVAHGLRYATKTDENARIGPSGELTRRPTVAEVADFVRSAAAPLTVLDVTATPDPSGALPGEPVEIRATYRVSYGVLDDLANGIKGVFFGGGSLPDSVLIT